MNLQELVKERQGHIESADKMLRVAENSGRELSTYESQQIDSSMKAVETLNVKIRAIQSNNTVLKNFPSMANLADAGRVGRSRFGKEPKKVFSEDYGNAFYELIQSAGTKVDAALYEGADGSGGYAVPVIVDDQIVPLAPQEMAVRRLAMVIPTVSDIKIPQKASFGTTTAKAELASFGENEPTLTQITLSAFMAGNVEEVSWELAQDVPAFQAFCVDDLVLAQQMYEENLYVNGTGSGQAQGLIGNVGAGVWEEPDSNGNLVTVNGTLDILSKLNAVYHPGASFLMSRATSIILRKAQAQANLFNPIWTRVGTQDYLHGYPVEYSAYMPTAARGAAPLLFGDFKRGYVIGDRGGSGINVKVLDQPLATQGILVLLAYRRTDGRVRRSEAIQQYNISAS
jgi:HK97 family phage major capsid protein